MTLFNTSLPFIRVRVLPRFPAIVQGANGIKVEKESGVYTIGPNVGELAEVTEIPDTGFVTVWDEQSDVYSRVDASALGRGDMAAAVYDPTGKEADAFDRANHSGTQVISTVTGLQTALDSKATTAAVTTTVNGLMIAADKVKLNGIATAATANDTDANLKNRANHTGTQSADTLTDGTTNKAFLTTERTKLSGIATGATANDTDANLKARANHTGTQPASTITGLATVATTGDFTDLLNKPAPSIANVATRTALKALDTASSTAAVLKETGREGTFIWKAGDYSAQVAADTQEGIYVKATAIAATAGAWVRAFDGPIDPRWFAAGTNDVTTALQAITALAQTDISIRIPAGDFVLTGAVAFVDKNLTIEGAGVGSTRLLCQNIAAKISFTDTSTTGAGTDLKRLNVSRLTIQKDHVTTAGAGGTAIEGTWNHTGPSSIEHASFTDLVVKGNGSTMFWHKGIRLVDVCSVNIDGCRIYNEVGHQTCLSAAAVEIVRNNCTNLIQFFVSNSFFGRYIDGFLFSQASAAVGAGTIEGFYLTNCEIINVARAFHEDNTALTTCSFDSITITNCHVAASRNGFFVGRTKGLTISSCVWFFVDYGEISTPAPFTSGIRGVLLMEGVRIVNSQFVRFDTQTTAGPLIQVPTSTGLNWVRIDNCSVANFSAVADTTGTRSTEKAKLFYGQNNYINSPIRTDTGFRGDRTTIAGSGSYASGAVVPFNQVFETTPNVVVTAGVATSGKTLGVSSITATGFTITHSDGVTALAIQWVAVG